MQYNPEKIFGSLPAANLELQILLERSDVYIRPVSGADHFYTDGASVGATYRIEMPDSSLNYLLADGTVKYAQSKILNAYEGTIRQFIRIETSI